MSDELQTEETPQSFMERLVAWYELGAILLRNKAIASEELEKSRSKVKAGKHRNLYEALVDARRIPETELRDSFEEGYREIASAFMALKVRLVTMERLRLLFEQAESEGRSLRQIMRENGIEPPDSPGPGGPGPRTPAPIIPHPGDPGHEAAS